MSEQVVFLSYAVDDRPFAKDLAQRMKGLGITIVDPALVMAAGDAWAEAISAQINTSDAVLLIVPSAGSNGANNAFFEAGAARALGKRVYAVLPERAAGRMKDVPADISSLLVTDASSQPIDQVARTLAGALAAAA